MNSENTSFEKPAALIYGAQKETWIFFLWQQHGIVETDPFPQNAACILTSIESDLACDAESTDVLLLLKVI